MGRAMVSTAVALGLVTACAAGCTDRESSAPASTILPPIIAPELVSEGSLVRGEGSASALMAARPFLLEDELQADGWEVVVTPAWQPIEVCIDTEPQALDERMYQRDYRSAVLVTVSLHEDEESAADELAYLRDGAAECWDSIWSVLTTWYEAFALPAPEGDGEALMPIEPFIDGPGSFTRHSLTDTEVGLVDLHSSGYVVDRVLMQVTAVTVGAEPAPGQHEALTAELHDAHRQLPTGVAPDPVIDAGVERLRGAVPDLAAESPAALPAGVEPGRWDAAQLARTDERCGVPGATGLYGPIWVWPLQDFFTQVAWTHGDPAAAEAAVAAMVAVDPECWFTTDERWWIDESSFRQGHTELVEVDGRSIAVVDISIDAELFGSTAPMRTIHTLTAVGPDTVGWIFRGLDGDEPDVLALTVDLADRLEAG